MSKPHATLDERLAALRREIDGVDGELVRALARRFDLVGQIAEVKAIKGEPVVVPARIEAVLTRVAKLAEELDLDPQIARRLWRQIIDEACALEEAHMAAR
jgi:chorismate mutase-like protein